MALHLQPLYTRALISCPAAIPHRVIEDDFYAGYYIPKDTIVIANVWYADYALFVRE